MLLSAEYKTRTEAIIALFKETFTASEGAGEGQLIARLAREMLTTVDTADIFVFLATEDDAIVAAIIFTRMTYAEEDRTIFILSPVAVAPTQQGKGVGQRLIRHGLDTLKGADVDVVLTYGDINFYSKVGFSQITEALAQPPFPLSYPHGWLGQSLTEGAFKPLRGTSTCVPALSDPGFW